MFVFTFRSSLAKIEPFLNPSLFFDSNGKRVSKLYLFLEDGEWKVECMGVVLIRADSVKLMWKRDT